MSDPAQDIDTKGDTIRLMGWLWRGYLSRHWRLLGIALVLMAVEGATLGAFAYMVQPMFDRIFVAGDSGALWWVGGIVMGLFALRALTSLGHRTLMTRVSEASAAALRGDLLDHIMLLDLRYHQANPPGSLIERVQGDVQQIGKLWTGVISGLGRDVIAVISLVGVALSIDWRWTLAMMVGVPLLVLPSLLAQRYVRRRSGGAREIAAKMSTRLDEVFHGITPIKLNALEAYQSRRYRALTRDRVRAETKAALGQATIPAMMDIMSGIGFFAVLVLGGSEIIAGEKTVGEFMAFFTAMSVAFDPLRRLGNLSGLIQTAAASVSRLRAVLDTAPALSVPAHPKAPPEGAPDIVLDAVEVSYGDLPVLHGASFIARAGETTALVGASGAGKSTVFNLLTRLVDASGGSVRIGGVETREMDPAALRGLFSVVTQDALLFDDTIRENILLGREDVTDAALREVLDAAHVSDFLPQLSDGLDTVAGPRGSALSGGQRQRVAIARALLRNTPVLLLDEATSALDTRSEAVVQAALERLSVGRTTLVIAHRLSTVRSAQSIVVMDRGQVVDQGTHEELIARGGLYADLHRLQFRDPA